MNDNNIEERLSAIEDTLDTLVERQKETTDLVQGYLDNLAGVIRDAEERISGAAEDAAERLTGEPEFREELKEALEALSQKLDALQVGKPVKGRVDEDALYEEVRAFVVAEGRASTSLLQRRFKIGYGAAVRLMDRLEEGEVLEPSDGTNRPRKVVGRDDGATLKPLDEDEKDEHYDEVVVFAREEGKVSTGMIQRRLRVGYGRAARIIDQLEQTGVIEASDGRRAMRKVVVK